MTISPEPTNDDQIVLRTNLPRGAWRLVIVRPGTEKQTLQDIKARGYEAFLPLDRFTVSRRPLRFQYRPLIPGALIVYVWSGMETLRGMQNVIRVVTEGNTFAKIPQDDIAAFRAHLGRHLAEDDVVIYPDATKAPQQVKAAGDWMPLDELKAAMARVAR